MTETTNGSPTIQIPGQRSPGESPVLQALRGGSTHPVGTPNADYIRDIGVTGKMARKLGYGYDDLHQDVQDPGRHNPHCEFTTGTELSAIRQKFLFKGRMDVKPEQDSWRLLLTAHEVQLAVQWTAMKLNRQFRSEEVVLTGILKGVFMFISDLCKLLTIPYNVYFLEASSYKDKQTQSSEVDFTSEINPSKFKGKKIILLDELFDNGRTLNSVKAALLSKLQIPADHVYTCTLFQKIKKTSQQPPDLVAFNVLSDVWVVGYGLDDQGTKRGWPHVFGVPKVGDAKRTEDDEMFDMDEEQQQGTNKKFEEVRVQFHKRLATLAMELTEKSASPTGKTFPSDVFSLDQP
eukprot:TRINITY_DN67831_c6_g5_i1.p2 TRINITY_DN67831_c6_g5~~TRINITY_DN67831_c6_g5_i1.p2  ORF type:complete len:348 (-),score=45.67 TRINITY_DN67831_c6_g5_i1:2599-3642(-)